MKTTSILAAAVLAAAASPAQAEVPDALAARGETLVLTAHAVGAQVYECGKSATGALIWKFREPIATLFVGGKTAGRHYAGPRWEMADGSVVAAKVSAKAPGASADDVPLLKLEATESTGSGQLEGVTTIQRLNTRGGVAGASCKATGDLLSVPYAADYAFYRKAR
jgi:hypothetical protein